MENLSEIPKKSKRWRTLFLDPETENAWTMLQRDKNSITAIVTFCESLDALLGGGIHLGQVTEIAGPAGSGKTQMCLQLAVDVQIPSCLGGVHGRAVYIDTESGFNTKRLKQISEAAVDHCRKVGNTDEERSAAEKFTSDDIFSNISFKKCRDIEELLNVAMGLEEFVRINDQIKLIIVDSVAFPFRYDDQHKFTNISRCQLQQRLKLALIRVAVRRNVAVVVTNHVTTKFTEQGTGYESTALGNNWGCDCATRLFLSSYQSQRFAYLMKSSNKPNGFASFRIESAGIRDGESKDANTIVNASDLREQICDILSQQQTAALNQLSMEEFSNVYQMK